MDIANKNNKQLSVEELSIELSDLHLERNDINYQLNPFNVPGLKEKNPFKSKLYVDPNNISRTYPDRDRVICENQVLVQEEENAYLRNKLKTLKAYKGTITNKVNEKWEKNGRTASFKDNVINRLASNGKKPLTISDVIKSFGLGNEEILVFEDNLKNYFKYKLETFGFGEYHARDYNRLHHKLIDYNRDPMPQIASIVRAGEWYAHGD